MSDFWLGFRKDPNSASRYERLKAARRKGSHTPDQWEALRTICGNRCVRCGGKDHIQPIYQGGSDAIENIQPLCPPCNSSKGPEAIDHRPADWRRRLR
jgi:5-methylcytosine-specific restriction endonuclease McrA